MNVSNPLDSVVFVTIPKNFTLSKDSFKIDKTIPLPVQMSSPDDEFSPNQLTEEMILAGILTILAYDKDNTHILYYRSLITSVRPSLKKELTEAAILKARNEDFDIAEEMFIAVQGLDPDDMATVLNTALFLDQRADSYRKSGLIDDAHAYDADAELYYKQVMIAEPAVPDAFFNAGFFYLKKKNFSQARECFKTYLTLVDSNELPDLSKDTQYKINRSQQMLADITNKNLDSELFKGAYDAINNGDEEAALKLIHSFLEKNPKVWNAWFMLGWALRKLGRWEKAKEAFEQCILCGGDAVDTSNELSLCLIELGDYTGAKTKLKDALKKEPENTKVMSNLGMLAMRQGNYTEATNYFNAVLAFDSDDKIALAALKQLENLQ
ncbi:MAG TPA: tetratricopeptide repeat protein, partial [Treponemataceae bacterium]|nr:tetratricopeptide repeat protein [Treponemataceae bacterium]